MRPPIKDKGCGKKTMGNSTSIFQLSGLGRVVTWPVGDFFQKSVSKQKEDKSGKMMESGRSSWRLGLDEHRDGFSTHSEAEIQK